jgi:CubicO group peptidase (beta-lactamase class C family)
LKNLLCPIVIALLFGCHTSSQKAPAPPSDSLAYYPPTPKELPKEVFRYYYNVAKNHFENSLLNRGFNGQILLAKNGTVVFEKTMGFADMRTKDSLSENTPMHIASVGKTFTAMAVMHLMEQGNLKLDDTLDKFFPGFPYQGITVKMLLSHRSGLPNYLNYLSELVKVKDTCYSNQDVLNSLYNLKPRLDSRSGTRFHYSNTNFVLLAMIIEKVTGEPFPVYMKKTFFDPLEMKSTFVYAGQDTLSPTPSFEWTGRVWERDPFDCTYGDKNIYTTAHDLLKWDQALSHGQFFKQSTLDSAYAPRSNERRSIHNYGLGWRMMTFPSGKKLIYHNGRWHGSNAVFVRFPDENATMIVIGNKYNSNIYHSAAKAYNLFGVYNPRLSQQYDDSDDAADDNSVGENSIKEEADTPKAKPVKSFKPVKTVKKKR